MAETTTPCPGIWPRLEGPTGIRIGGETPWVRAFFRGVPIAGVSFKSARYDEDAGRRWLLQHVFYNWGSDVAQKINAHEVIDDG